MMRAMVIDMNDAKLQTLDQVRAFLEGTIPIDFSLAPNERYDFVARTVRRFGYARLKRPDKSVVLRFLECVSGYSRQQLTRLVGRAGVNAPLVKRYRGSRTSFTRSFTETDVRLLAHTDTLHGTLSGPATKKLMERAWLVFDDAPYERLATISVAHLYTCASAQAIFATARPGPRPARSISPLASAVPLHRTIGPGICAWIACTKAIRTASKASTTVNAVDCVTQYEAVASCERISEAFLIPVLEELLTSFPFPILGFHVDNGSEYINRHVAELLNKLLIEEFTKSRSRHSNDNALVESKNAAIVRKHLGYSHIPQRFAAPVNAFCRDYLNPYVNFHRPCLFAETRTDAKGRERKRYPYNLMMTPYEKLKSLPQAEQFLRNGLSFEQLDVQAHAISDNDAAQRLNTARATLFKIIFNRSKSAA